MTEFEILTLFWALARPKLQKTAMIKSAASAASLSVPGRQKRVGKKSQTSTFSIGWLGPQPEVGTLNSVERPDKELLTLLKSKI